jgi:hypothetical protein
MPRNRWQALRNRLDHASHADWPRLCSSAGPVAVSQVVTRPIPIEVQERVRAALAVHTEVRFVEDTQSVIQPDSRVRDDGVLITLPPVPEPLDNQSPGVSLPTQRA